MNSKLFFIALVSLFFQSVISGTVPTNSEVAKTVTTESVIPAKANESVKAEASSGSNATEGRDGIEYITTPRPEISSSKAPNVTEVPKNETTTEAPKPSTSEKPPTTTTTTTTTTNKTTPETPKPSTSMKPTTASTSTSSTSTVAPTVKPEPVPTAATETSVKAPTSTTATIIQNRSFDAPNFIGGIILTLGLTAIGFIAFKFYKARKAEGNYRTL